MTCARISSYCSFFSWTLNRCGLGLCELLAGCVACLLGTSTLYALCCLLCFRVGAVSRKSEPRESMTADRRASRLPTNSCGDKNDPRMAMEARRLVIAGLRKGLRDPGRWTLPLKLGELHGVH